MAKPKTEPAAPQGKEPMPEQQPEAKPLNGREPIYSFTPDQRETVADIFTSIDRLQSNLNFFLNHVVREAKLPKTDNGYALNRERTGLITREQAAAEGLLPG